MEEQEPKQPGETDRQLETDRLLRYAAERVLELAEDRAKEVLDNAAGDAKNILDKAKRTARLGIVDNNSWHIGKEIPLSVIGIVIVQTIGIVWSIAQLWGTVGALVTQNAEFKIERYTREDARRDRELIEQKIEGQRSAGRELERRINLIESKSDRPSQPR